MPTLIDRYDDPWFTHNDVLTTTWSGLSAAEEHGMNQISQRVFCDLISSSGFEQMLRDIVNKILDERLSIEVDEEKFDSICGQ